MVAGRDLRWLDLSRQGVGWFDWRGVGEFAECRIVAEIGGDSHDTPHGKTQPGLPAITAINIRLIAVSVDVIAASPWAQDVPAARARARFGGAAT
jgi:hypothetical protein